MDGIYRVLPVILAVALMVTLPAGGALAPSANGVTSWALEGKSSGSSQPAESAQLAGMVSVHYHVTDVSIIDQYNGSSSISELSVFRALQAQFFADYSTPANGVEANVTAVTTEVMVAHENVTWAGSMTGTGVSEPALAILNASATLSQNFTVTSLRTFAASGQVSTRSSSAYIASALQASFSMGFAQPLGVIPVDTSSGHQWRSAANFTLLGSFQGSFHYLIQAGFNGSAPLSGSGTPSGTIAPSSGGVSILDTTTGTTNLSGVGVYGVQVMVPGSQFVMIDGVLLPSEVEPFNTGTFSWWHPPEDPAMESVSTESFLVSMPGSGNRGILGADETYSAVMETPSPSHPSGDSSTPVQSVSVLSSPVPTSAAWGDYDAISAPLNPQSQPGSGAYPLFWWGLVGVVAATAVAGAVVGTQRRRKRGRGAFPPHVRSGGEPSERGRSTVQIPQDPLEHLL